MRTFAWLTATTTAVLLVVPARTWSQQNDQAASQGQIQNQAQSAAGSQNSVAEAARKAREHKKEAPSSVKTFTNDNLPTAGGISTVGESSATASPQGSSASSGEAAGKGATAETPNDEKSWRKRFEALHHKLEQDQANLEVMQRELAQLSVQYYNDPSKALQQQFTRGDINDKRSAIDKMQAQIDTDKQAISDAEDELRKSGGDPSWSR